MRRTTEPHACAMVAGKGAHLVQCCLDRSGPASYTKSSISRVNPLAVIGESSYGWREVQGSQRVPGKHLAVQSWHGAALILAWIENRAGATQRVFSFPPRE
jgi:hypothetical protein